MVRHFERPLDGTERQIVQGHIDLARNALISKLDGLDREQAGKHLVPSLTTLLGLI